MSETQNDASYDQTNRAFDEMMQNVINMNDGLSGLITGAMRMQMLVLEDTQNMLAEFGAVIEATAGHDGDGSDA